MSLSIRASYIQASALFFSLDIDHILISDPLLLLYVSKMSRKSQVSRSRNVTVLPLCYSAMEGVQYMPSPGDDDFRTSKRREVRSSGPRDIPACCPQPKRKGDEHSESLLDQGGVCELASFTA